MIRPFDASDWSPVTFPAELFDESSAAPVVMPPDSPREFAVLFAALLEDLSIPNSLLQQFLSTATIVVYGAREFISRANLLTAPDQPRNSGRDQIEQLLACVTTLAGERQSAYSLQQVGDLAASKRDAVTDDLRLRRTPRRFMKPLERRLQELDVPARMELDRLGRLLVQLDEFYDDSCLLLHRLGTLAAYDLADARDQFPGFLHHAYRDFAVASFDDHLIADPPAEPPPAELTDEAVPEEKAPPPPGEGRRGLLDLLPELLSSLD
ncbi:MAG: hypothetical protein MK538_04485 [Planctomycetes bacterium]|nr:hypothetical protein [Planctomycetota bacterium]